MIAGQHVGEDLLVGVAQVGRGIGVVDGGGDVETHGCDVRKKNLENGLPGEREGFWSDQEALEESEGGGSSFLILPPQERMRALAPAASASAIWLSRT